MKNNELTAVKGEMPLLDGLPQPVIEYVMGLVAENEFIREEHEQSLGPCACVSLPATKLIIDEIGAKAVEEFASSVGAEAEGLSPSSKEYKSIKSTVFRAVKFAANLRAGRKG